MHPNLPFWLAAMYLQGIGPRTVLRWLKHFSIEKIFKATTTELRAAGFNTNEIYQVQNPAWKLISADLAWAQDPNHHILCLEDAAYPVFLKEIPDPPLVLFIKGNASILLQKQLAIVGSRHATPLGIKTAEEFAYYLAQAKFAITSGLALGIDGASHRGALRAKGLTIGVAGTGLDHIYPPSHKKLVADILDHDGAIISEFPLATLPKPANFPRRNRIISGLSVGVLIIEAALKSGSLITAQLSLEQGREVFAIPGSIHHPLARGCHYLIRQGAKLVETASDILEELGAHQLPLLNMPSDCLIAEAMGADCWQLFEIIGYEITPMDVILLRSGLTANVVSSILLTLELKGYIESVAGGYIRSCAKF